jgi:phosphatidylserine/phosphatidylglycerophosphate/cardiolipin synthase-like enzyme
MNRGTRLPWIVSSPFYTLLSHFAVLHLLGVGIGVCHAATRHQSFEEWRRLTATNALPPLVLVHDDEIRFYFPDRSKTIGFKAKLGHLRVPTTGYQVSSALLRLEKNVPRVTAGAPGWRQPLIITGQEWRYLATNLLAGLTPATPGHAKYYRGLFAERLLYRDSQGKAALAPITQPPSGVVIDHRYSIEESLQFLAVLAEPHLVRDYPGQSLFLLFVHPRRFPQPLLIDVRHRRCIWLSPAALFEPREPALPLAPTADGISALIFESHGLALVKNPVSSVARLVNLLTESLASLVRLPFPKPRGAVPPLAHAPGMDLICWEKWLDDHTSSPRGYGSLRLLIDGERFFPRFQDAISKAENHIEIHVFMFDNDDVALGIADQLKQRSAQVHVRVIFDRLATMEAARIPPATPPPKPYVPPASISSYLKKDSHVEARPFLNPFCSYDHSKVYIVDGTRAWMGGMNIGREYRSEWHDMMVELSGPILGSLEREFQLDWAHAGPLGDLAYLDALLKEPKPPKIAPPLEPWLQLRLLPTKTIRKPFAKAVLHALDWAKSYIYVENPYLFDKRVMSGLVHARERGVDVRVILPHVNDSPTGGRAELVAANYLVEQGVRVFFYPGMTHVKALLVDDWACVGSGNLNQFGLALCQEHNVGTSDRVFSAKLKHDLFEEDFTHCYELSEPVEVEWKDFLADFVLEGL